MKTVNVRGVILGDGVLKVCIPLVGRNIEELKIELDSLNKVHFDLIEFRADFLEDVEDIEKVKKLILNVRTVLKNKPIIFTFRSIGEGGSKYVTDEYYFNLNKEIIKTGLVDIIDIEITKNKSLILELIKVAHEENRKVIISTHNFNNTPSKEEIIKKLIKMENFKGDIIKIAVMANGKKDILTLFNAIEEMKGKCLKVPLIAMSMGKIGMISRIIGGEFGSALTFASLKKTSAPGQICVNKLNSILKFFYEK